MKFKTLWEDGDTAMHHDLAHEILASHGYAREELGYNKYNGPRTTDWAKLHTDLTGVGWKKVRDHDDGLGRTIKYQHGESPKNQVMFNSLNGGGAPDIAFNQR